jgi:hypothetical protein
MNFILERVNAVCRHVRDSNKFSLTFKKLVSVTRTSFRKYDCVLSIKTKKDKTLEPSEFYVNAFYDAEDDYNNDVAIEIYIYHNFTDDMMFNSTQITDFLIQVYDATVHEYRHQQQSIQREYNIYSDHDHSPFKSYLKDPDELDAYAVSIAIELLRHMSKERAKKYMSKITIMAKMRRGTNLVSPNLKAYIDHFGLNNVTKKISKKVYKHLDVLDRQHIFM